MDVMRYITIAFSLVSLAACARAVPIECTPEKDNAAENAVDRANDWSSIYGIFMQFEDCDNGGTAESISDLVVRQLANHWKDADQLVALTVKNDQFRKFVISHINGTADDNDLKRIVFNMDTACPKNARYLCVEISRRAKTAIIDSRNTQQTD